MTAAVALAILAALVTPYVWPKRLLSPVGGITLWLSELALRALLVVVLVIVGALYMPATALFQLVSQWCFHAVVPFFAVHFGFSGHALGDAALFVPAIVLSLSALYGLYGTWRAARRVAAWARRSGLGIGPKRSVVVSDPEILVAATGMRRPQVVVSTGALTKLDEQELEAGLEHEWGHIHRGHRYLALAGQAFFTLARLMPGSRRAFNELHFFLERDADEYAVRTTGDPLALASAICKSALVPMPPPSPAFSSLSGNAGAARLEPLLDQERKPGLLAHSSSLVFGLFPAAMASLILAFLPAIAAAGITQASTGVVPSC